jgi:hypothetical protein
MARTIREVISPLPESRLAGRRKREREDLAREGYQLYSREAEEFAEASLAAVSEAMGSRWPPPPGSGKEEGSQPPYG